MSRHSGTQDDLVSCVSLPDTILSLAKHTEKCDGVAQLREFGGQVSAPAPAGSLSDPAPSTKPPVLSVAASFLQKFPFARPIKQEKRTLSQLQN